MKPPSSLASSSRATVYQTILFAIAIVGTGILLLYFPEPKPLISTPLPDNLIVISATTIVPADRVAGVYPPAGVYPVSGANVSFHSLMGGKISKYELKTKTDNSGFAQIRLYAGEYVVQVADWTPQKIVITNDSMVSIRRFEIEDTPDVKITAVSKDWEIAPNDLMTITYENHFEKLLLLRSITFYGRPIESVRCRTEARNASAGQCAITVELQPGDKWSETFQNPSGSSIGWDSARRSLGISLHLSYVEADVKSKPMG